MCGNGGGGQIGGGPGGGPPNVNLNMKIQISAQAPPQSDLMTAGGGPMNPNMCFPGDYCPSGPQMFDEEDVL